MVLDPVGTADTPSLLVDRVVKRYGANLVLDNLSLRIDSGVVYGLVGPNGGGKSTLLRILATLERQSAGRVSVLGHDTLVEPRAARRLLGYAGTPTGTPELTIAEEVDLTARLAGVGASARAEAVGALLELVDLHDRRHRQIGQLSRGDLKRLAIARALVHDPAVVLLDCPFDGLDAAGRHELREVFAELAALEKALVIAGDGLAEIADLCHEVGVLDRGRLVLSGPPAAVLVAGEIGRPLRLRLADGADVARLTLEQHSMVHDVVALDDATLRFRFAGGSADQADLLRALIQAGASVAELAPATEEAETDLARLVRAGP